MSRGERLLELVAVAEERKAAIERARELRREARERFDRDTAKAKALHHNANRVLVEAAEAAQGVGIRKSEIARQIGMTAQALNQMRRAVQDWDGEETSDG